MVKISKETFIELQLLGFIKDTKNNRNFYIANKRNAKSKTYYIQEDVMEEFCKYL